MAVFISYTHADADFVDRLAAHLIAGNARVWVDRWELHVGDSLRQRVEDAMEQASAIVVVLSQAAVESEWCQRELSAGFIRELEEQRVIVLPVLTEDCEVPLFLRDKMYADFRTDFDDGLRHVREALARVTAEGLGRLDEADGAIDWSTVWGVDETGEVKMFITVLQQSDLNPYSVLSRVTVTLNEVASRRHLELTAAGAEGLARQLVLEVLGDWPELEEFRIILDDAEPVTGERRAEDQGPGLSFTLQAVCQRMGEDTGRDVLVPIGAVLKSLAAQTRDRLRPVEPEERERAMQILRDYRPGLGS